MSTAQIEDWILERTGKTQLPFGERSLRRYVNDLREEYGIEKPESVRQYEAVEDPAFGAQAQVDMGEILLKTENGGHKKVYGFSYAQSIILGKGIVSKDKCLL